MPSVPFKADTTGVALRSAPIRPEWITEGRPLARVAELSRSADGQACTVVWDCTAGRFTWHYGSDETIYVIEGSATLRDDGNPPRVLGPGDVVFLPKGAVVDWTVDRYVKKVAFFRRTLPNPLTPAFKLARRAKYWLRGRPMPDSAPGMAVETR